MCSCAARHACSDILLLPRAERFELLT
jgi:hypothetical protein